MNVFETESKIIITCNKRLSPYLQQEVEALGFTITRAFQTGVELRGTVNDCIPLNLNLRCASQILYLIHSFEAADPQRLYNELVQIEWEKLIDFTGYFSITSNVNNEHILTPLYANVKVKDAVVDRIKAQSCTAPVLAR
jgi:putative N6-adenine-specific DNA methylase